MTDSAPSASQRAPHPVLWLILYVPFGALSGFITIGLGFRATQHGLSITDGALLGGAQLLISWLKWLWAPVVDITLSPKRWYLGSTAFTALGVLAMSVIPLEKHWLGVLLAVIAVTSFAGSIVGMAAEAMITALTPPEQVGRMSGWFQSGNLGGNSLGGGIGLVLFEYVRAPWVAGAAVAAVLGACCLALIPLPPMANGHAGELGPAAAVKGVAVGLWQMLKTRTGFLSAFLCLLPVGTGVAQGTMAQAAVAEYWHAGASQVALLQGCLVGVVTAVGCFGGGWVCDRLNPRASYAVFGLVLAAVATAMAFGPATVTGFVVGNLVYALGTGLAYAAFTAVALTAVGDGPAATGYNVFASLSNFPIWWLGLLLGWVADPSHGARHTAPAMLLTEAALGVVGVLVFAGVSRISGQALFAPTRARVAVEPTI